MKDEALKLALEALELVNIEFVCNGAHHAKKDRHELGDDCPVTARYQNAITAIKAALAQPAQKPFGHWHWEQPMTKPLQGWFVKGPSDGKLNGVSGIALYTAPQEQWNAAH